MLHCDLRLRWKVASDLRFRAAISEPKTPSFCGISGDLAQSTRKSLAIAIVRFWCAKDFSEFRGGFGRKFPEGGPDFLEVALVWKFPYGVLPKQTSKKFASEPPKLLRSPSRSGSMQKLVLALSYVSLQHQLRVGML